MSAGRVSVKYRPSGGEVSEGVGRHACRSTYRPRVSTDTRSTDALSTHDPGIVP